MKADELESFLNESPEYQRLVIDMHRESERRADEMSELEKFHKLDNEQRAELILKHTSWLRRSILAASWWVYCKAWPKWAK